MLCTYNGERFLQAQVDSLLAQDWSNIEIIVSDDHSTDNTPAILRAYAGDARFRMFFQEKNLGAIGNFDFAVRQTRGEYIAFADQDDVWLPQKLTTLYQAIGKHALVYSDSLLVDENGQSLGKKLSDLRRMYSGSDLAGFVFSNVVWGHAMMIHRQLLDKALPIPSQVPHDVWFAVNAAAATGIVYVNEVLTHYRQHSSTVTTTIAQKAVTRPKEKRFRDFENLLQWIGLLKQCAPQSDAAFFAELESNYSTKRRGHFSWPLFYFLLRNEKRLFGFTRKGFVSRLIEIRKQSRGERLT